MFETCLLPGTFLGICGGICEDRSEGLTPGTRPGGDPSGHFVRHPHEIAAVRERDGLSPAVNSELVEDMLEYGYYGQNDSNTGTDSIFASVGSWGYNENGGHPDHSTSQWPVIGGMAAQRVFGIAPPAWVQNLNLGWIHLSQTMGGSASATDGQFGYGAGGYNFSCAWDDCQATTPSGLAQTRLIDSQLVLGLQLALHDVVSQVE